MFSPHTRGLKDRWSPNRHLIQVFPACAGIEGHGDRQQRRERGVSPHHPPSQSIPALSIGARLYRAIGQFAVQRDRLFVHLVEDDGQAVLVDPSAVFVDHHIGNRVRRRPQHLQNPFSAKIRAGT